MPHDVPLITTLAAGFGLALILGFAAARLRLPPLLGYLLAGVIIGPGTPGFVADVALAGQLAEIGVMLLMFGVGLHFSLADLLAVRKVAVPGAVVQIGVATLMGMGVAWCWGWPIGAGLVLGLALSVASTVVLLRALESRGELDSSNGRLAVGWLVVEDLVMVLVLVLLPPLAGVLGGSSAAGGGAVEGSLWTALGITLAKVAAFIALMLVVGRRVLPKVLWWVAGAGSRELFTLCVIAAALGVAYGSAKLFDVSFALGAFFSGMMLRESEYSHRAADESLPLRDAFSVLFFCVGGDVVRSGGAADRSGQGAGGHAGDHGRQNPGGDCLGVADAPAAEHRADCWCEPGADWRVFVYLGRAGRRAELAAARGAKPDSGRRHVVDCLQQPVVCRHHPAGAALARALPLGARAGLAA